MFTNRWCKVMVNKPLRLTERRTFLKSTAVAGIAALAGCTGGGGGDGGDGSGGDGGDGGDGSDGCGGDGGDGGTTTGEPDNGLKWEGVEIEYWNRLGTNTKLAEPAIRQAIKNFEEDTGATVNVTWARTEALNQWLTLFQEGRRPHVMDQPTGGSGPFVQLDSVKPYEDYQQWFSDETVENISWMMDRVGPMVYGGFDGKAYDMKFSNEGVRTFIVRADHAEEAGISVEDEFPPEDHEHSVQIGQTLQEDGPADYGWQIYGSTGDVTDTYTEDTPACYGGVDGVCLNSDWTDTNIDNEHFLRSYEEFVALLTEHELSHPESVSMSDEDATGLLIEGTASMTSVPPASYADVLGQAPEMIENGQFYFSTNWKGSSGARGIVGGDGIMFPKPPEGTDEDEWNTKQEAAADLMDNYLFFSEFFQEQMFTTIGGGPIREDMTAEDVMSAVSDPTGYEQTNIINATLNGAFDNDNIIIEPQAPMYSAVQQGVLPPQIQQAMQGSKSVEKALNDAAEEARNRFF